MSGYSRLLVSKVRFIISSYPALGVGFGCDHSRIMWVPNLTLRVPPVGLSLLRANVLLEGTQKFT